MGLAFDRSLLLIAPTRSTWRYLIRFFWVGLGGAVGSLARYWLALVVNHPGFPWATLAVNLSGSFALGFLFAYSLGRWPTEVVIPLSVGVLGGFTTFSTFAWETLHLAQNGPVGLPLAYMAATMVGGMAAVFGGYLLGRGLI